MKQTRLQIFFGTMYLADTVSFFKDNSWHQLADAVGGIAMLVLFGVFTFWNLTSHD